MGSTGRWSPSLDSSASRVFTSSANSLRFAYLPLSPYTQPLCPLPRSASCTCCSPTCHRPGPWTTSNRYLFNKAWWWALLSPISRVQLTHLLTGSLHAPDRMLGTQLPNRRHRSATAELDLSQHPAGSHPWPPDRGLFLLNFLFLLFIFYLFILYLFIYLSFIRVPASTKK